MTTYSVRLITYTDGQEQGSYLSVKGRTEWKTKRIAQEYARQIRTLINKGRNIFGADAVECVDQFGENVPFSGTN